MGYSRPDDLWERAVDEAILFIASDGAIWTEKQTVTKLSLDDPTPHERIVAIEDGTGLPRPWLFYVLPNRV